MGSLILIAIASAVVAVVALVFIILLIVRKKDIARSDRNQESIKCQDSALWAKAVIAYVTGGLPSEGATQARMTLTLDVIPTEGEAYRASTVWLVDITELESVRQGQELSVRIDTADRKIIYPAEAWAHYVVL